MFVRALFRSLVIFPGICLLSVAFLSPRDSSAQAPFRLAPLAQGSADATAHKQWMNDASDAQEDVRFAVTDKDQKAAVEALGKIDALMARTADYWTAKKATDGVTLAKDARALVAQSSASAQSGNWTAAAGAFDKMGAACNTCHELHLPRTSHRPLNAVVAGVREADQRAEAPLLERLLIGRSVRIQPDCRKSG